MKKPGKAGHLDPAAVCRSSDPTAVRELLTKIGDTWTIFLVLSLDLLGGRARFSELERAVPGISLRRTPLSRPKNGDPSLLSHQGSVMTALR
jgi:hypothetical protein